MHTEFKSQRVSRRGLLRIMGTVGMGIAGVACSSPTRSQPSSSAPPAKLPSLFDPNRPSKPLTVGEKVESTDKLQLPTPAVAPSASRGRIHVSIWNLGPGTPEALHQLFRAYSVPRPGHDVTFSILPFAEHHANLLTNAAAGTESDVLVVDGLYFPAVAESGAVLPLDGRLGSIDRHDYFRPWSDQSTYADRWYGFLFQTVTYLPILNVNAFKRAGLEVPDLDNWTWDQYADLAQRLTVDSNGRRPTESGFDPATIVQFGTRIGVADHTDIAMGLSSSGNRLFDGQRDRIRRHARLDAPEFIAATEAVLQLSLMHKASPMPADVLRLAPDSFRAGQVAIGWIWSDLLATSLTVPEYFPFSVETAMFPRWQGKPGGMVNAAILAMGQNTRQRDVTWDLLSWMGTNPEFVLGTNATTGLPYTNSLATRASSMWPKDLYGLQRRHIETIRSGYSRPYGAEGVQINSEVLRPLRQKLQLGVVDVPSAWREASARINQVLASRANLAGTQRS
jgi:multiple sugar transport system substrate-binding protein